ncbi:MAG: DNA polymerase III subunit epsilon, partial [Aurantimonas coralicida]|nr:DNA polymerase III subunit epsilon [Aurantimonas coralicida]
DADCTALLWRPSAATVLPRCPPAHDFLARAERVSNEPALLARLRIGRHKGVALAEVPDAYLEWLLREPGMEADAVFTARHHLRLRSVRGARQMPATAV